MVDALKMINFTKGDDGRREVKGGEGAKGGEGPPVVPLRH